MRIPYSQLKAEFERILLTLGFTGVDAAACAAIFANNSRDGVESHGLNRFPVFVDYVRNGLVLPHAKPVKVTGFGALEQ